MPDDIHAGDIRLLNRVQAHERIRELLDAETRYVARIERLEAALMRVRDIGLGTDRGTPSWQLQVVEQIAKDALNAR